MKPVLLVTNHAPPDRVALFAALHEREDIELALFGGRLQHATASASATELAIPHRRVSQRHVRALAASGRYRAVIAGINGRVALPAAYLGAQRSRAPFLLWTSLWAHPRSPAHLLSRPLAERLYRDADAVIAYGPHVARYASAHGARNVDVAPQAVDAAFWSAPAPEPHRRAPFQALFVGRDAPEKGVEVLRAAWARAGLGDDAALVLVGIREPAGVGRQPPAEVRNFLAGSDVLVVPSLRTATFREPWGLVVNEAMHQHLPVIASTEVGAAAGGLVVHERTGLVVPAGEPDALADALRRLHDDANLRTTMGEAGSRRAASYTPEAWAAGVSAALASVGASRQP